MVFWDKADGGREGEKDKLERGSKMGGSKRHGFLFEPGASYGRNNYIYFFCKKGKFDAAIIGKSNVLQ